LYPGRRRTYLDHDGLDLSGRTNPNTPTDSLAPTVGQPRSWISELARRHVLRAAGIYVISGVAAVEAADLLFPRLGIPGWGTQLVLGLAIAGLPVAVALAWTYDLTPQGVRRTSRRRRPQAERTQAGPTAAVARAAIQRSVPADGRKAVAVLPFANLSADAENGYFSDGITEDILTNLSRVDELRVVSRTSVMRYRGTTLPVREIAAELGVGSVLEGSVRVAGGRVRVVAQLIDAASDAHLWAESYDRRLDDVFAVQSEVAEAVARALEARLTTVEIARMHTPQTRDVQAYALCLKGYAALGTWAPTDLDHAIRHFEAALRVDPDYARAHAALGIACAIYPAFAGSTPAYYQQRVQHAARRALELDERLGHAHVAHSYALWSIDRDWIAAEREIQRALELEPEDVHVLTSAAYYLGQLGRFGEAQDLCERANAVHPTVAADSILGMVEYYRAGFGSGDPGPALRHIDSVIAREPTQLSGHLHRAFCLTITQRYEEALESCDVAARLSPDTPILHGVRCLVLHRLGRHADALEEERWFASRDAAERDSYAWSLAAFGGGDLDRAFDLLDRAFEERAFFLPFLRITPRFQPLWQHPRYVALIGRLWPGEHKQVLGEYGWREASGA
jgi:adenylate cyclase